MALAQALGGFLPVRFWAMGKSKRESGSRKAPKKTKKDDDKKKRKDKKKKKSSSSSSSSQLETPPQSTSPLLKLKKRVRLVKLLG